MNRFFERIYYFMKLNEKGFYLIYICAVALLCGGIFNIKFILNILAIWRTSFFSLFGKFENIVTRIVAIILGILLVMIPITMEEFR